MTNLKDKISILIVDDDKDIRENLVTMLQSQNYFVLAADSVASAFSKVSSFNFDLLIIDIRLANETTIDLIKYIRSTKTGRNRNTPIILASGNIDEAVVASLRGLINDAAVKPYSREDIIKKVAALAGVPVRPESKEAPSN